MKIVFITFGSHGNYVDAGNRLIHQAKQLNIFTETILYTSEYLQNDPEFWSRHSDFITTNRRGFGYWLWKSYITKKTMETMADGDILLYLDCGCELDLNRKENLLKCIHVVKTDKIVGTKVNAHLERRWNKMDLIKKLDMNKNEYLNTDQRQGGTNLFLVCEETRLLVNEWYDVCCEYNNINDSPSVIPNARDFRAHRHDQSVFSLLTKKYNIFSKTTLDNAIYVYRNLTGVTKIK